MNNKRVLVFVILSMIAIISWILPSAVMAQEEIPRVSVMFYETDLREALNELALQSGVNILMDNTVSGVVTLTLKDVPLDVALKLLCIPGGYTFSSGDGYYLVGLPDPLNRIFHNLAESRVIRLKHLLAKDVAPILPSYAEQYIEYSRDGNQVVITAPPEMIDKIAAIIEEIDRPQVVRQVKIKALVTEISTSELKKWGLDKFELDVHKGQSINPNWIAFLGLTDNSLSLKTDLFGCLVSKFKALQADKDAKIHADPTIIVADGKEAVLFTGETRIVEYKSTENSTSTQLKNIEAGVRLTATPTILENGKILLNIVPEISYLSKTDEEPTVYQSQVQTTVQVDSNEVAMISGLTILSEVNNDSRIPILGSIPIAGWLFRSFTDAQDERKLMVFVSAEEVVNLHE